MTAGTGQTTCFFALFAAIRMDVGWGPVGHLAGDAVGKDKLGLSLHNRLKMN